MRRPLLFGLLAGAVAFVTLVVFAVVAVVGIVDRDRALDEHRRAEADLAPAVADADVAGAEAEAVLAFAADPLLPADAVSAVTEERDAAADALADADPLAATEPEALDTEGVRELSGRLRAAAAGLRDDDELVLAALNDLVRAAGDTASAVEAANFSAENPPHLAFRAAVGDLGAVTGETIASSLE